MSQEMKALPKAPKVDVALIADIKETTFATAHEALSKSAAAFVGFMAVAAAAKNVLFLLHTLAAGSVVQSRMFARRSVK